MAGRIRAIRGRWLGVVLAALALALLVAARWPAPYFVILPGETANVGRLVRVAGRTNPVRGRLLLVAVTMEQTSELSHLYYRLTGAEIWPAADILPHGSFADYLKFSQAEMQESQESAKVAALGAAGFHLQGLSQGVKVLGILPHSPAADRLRSGDIIRQVDGRSVRLAADLQAQVRRQRVGTTVNLEILRGKERRTVVLRTVKSSLDPHQAMIGVAIVTDWKLPVSIQIQAGDISGPSAGLMFSLQILSGLLGRDLSHGRWVAGTGTIDATGNVGAIGGISAKVVTAAQAGARYFLVPWGNYAEARRTVGRDDLHLKLIPVGHLAGAVRALESESQAGIERSATGHA